MSSSTLLHVVATVATVATVACADTRPDPEVPVVPPLGASTASTTADPADEDAPPPELVVLRTAITGLQHQGRLDHANIVQALEALADALDLVSTPRTDVVQAIRTTADRLGSSPDHAMDHADLVRRGLEHALVALASGSPQSRLRLSEYSAAIGAFGDLVEMIDPGRPLLSQHLQVVAAFEAAARALEVASLRSP